MGLLQKAVETFDCHNAYVGVVREGHHVLPPISHIVTSAQLEITLDPDGRFVDAAAFDKNAPKVIIPVTEESAGRTSAPAAHPLCDQLGYLTPLQEKKYKLYLDGLRAWAQSPYSHPKLRPILQYVQSGTILDDLASLALIQCDAHGLPANEKALVCWRIVGLDESQPTACWMDTSLMHAYVQYILAQKQTQEKQLCLICGEMVPAGTNHPKGIIPINGNAKLISANDANGFTYRGRFDQDIQAASIGFEASQKAHCALRWLAAEQGIQVVYGGRTFLTWNPQGKKVCSAVGIFRKNTAARVIPSDYKQDLLDTLNGMRTTLSPAEGVVIAAFDAATTGRLSLTYYNELPGSDFLQRLYDWDLTCCWLNGAFGIQSPYLKQIVDCAFGTQRTEKNQTRMVTDDRILREQMQRLVACRIDKARIPRDFVTALANRASTPHAYEVNVWRRILFTACAVLNKYETDRKGMNVLSWELLKKDRSFQYGRLLAVMERLELDYYNKSGEDRLTAAIKAMPEFRRRPWNIYERVNRHLTQAYLPRVERWQRERYARMKDEITGILREFPQEELNRPLDDIYLMGYDLQHAEFFKSKKTTEESEEEQA